MMYFVIPTRGHLKYSRCVRIQYVNRVYSRDDEAVWLRYEGCVGISLYDVLRHRLGSADFLSFMSSCCRLLFFSWYVY